ncbi:MAG: phosphate ABC transporter permease PstA [Actinomycetota bacterium]|nr:phosphate ABC transporter permease PstA [Actinomycetota bacterium]HZY65165.1 phosphate ABC transporter permease PstA [Rubrobacteraceae bacterium]
MSNSLAGNSDNYRRRKIMDKAMTVVAYACTILAVVFLLWVLAYVVIKGIGAWDLSFFTDTTALFGDGGGIANAMYGTLVIVLLAVAMGLPAGIMAGIFLAEYGDNRFGSFTRFIADTMAGIPSIVVGLVVYGLLVLLFGYSGFAGAVSLAILMLPIITRTTEGVIRLVPQDVREASLALGIPQWKTTLRVVLPTAAAGIVTGVFLATARAAGETAPLIFTILGSSFWNKNPFEGAMQAVSLYVYQASANPFAAVQEAAWGAALVLVIFVMIFNLAARLVALRRKI